MARRPPITEDSPREHVIELVRDLPADTSYEEILREVAFARMIDQGLTDFDSGRIVRHEEAGRVIASWAKEPGCRASTSDV